MQSRIRVVTPASLVLPVFLLAGCATTATDPLPSWNAGPTREAIVDFVQRVTDPSSAEYVPASERIAVFDNDGTLWAEQPAYFQLLFALERVKALASQHPEWKEREPFRSVLAGDVQGALAGGEKAIVELVMATHAGMTPDEFAAVARDWLASARHPNTGRLYTEMVYRPMLELLAYLRANGFETFLVSGGGIEFLRAFSERVYGIPPEQVVGSTIVTELEERDGVPVLVRKPAVDFVDDGPGKPAGIQRHVGRRPIAAFGNSDGDLQMLQWTTAGAGPRFALLVHHTDAAREWAYDRGSKIGALDAALDAARARGWTVVDVRADWKRVFPFDQP